MRQNGERLDLALKELSSNAAVPLTNPMTLSKLLSLSGLHFSDFRMRIKYFSHWVDMRTE